MSSYSHAPWTSAYPDGLPNEITPPHNTMVEVVNAAVALSPERTAIQYFDAGLSFTELNDAAEALAAALIECGFAPGNRLALYLQNDPAFVIGLLAAWKAGGCAVMINPMNKPRELSHLLSDSGATAMLCLDTLHQSVVSEVIASGTAPALTDVVTTSARYLQTRNDVRVLIDTPLHQLPGSVMLEELLTEYRGRHPAAVPPPKPDEPAVLTYTSGTTGIPKAAVNTHGAMAFNSFTYHHWMKLSAEDCILGIAPLFHITGLVGHIGAALASRCSLILTHRFEPAVVLDAQREHRPTFTVAAVTALSSLLSCSQDPRDFESLRAVYSGGAPISPALAEDFQRATGCRIHNIYGLTETTSPALATPLGAVGRVDHRTGALSVGVPVFNTTVRVLDDDGNELPAGELGEIAIKGPQVIAAYWN
ncbi:MAG: class I adenylate-forming enzyme family protein, partial [Mycobacterium sp.]